MFEKQSNIKDLTLFKNKINDLLSNNFNIEFDNNNIIINNLKGKAVFKGKIGNNPIGCFINGDFMAEKQVSKVALVVVILYVVFLITTYVAGPILYDYQIFMMVVALAIIALMKKFTEKRVSPLKKILEELN